MGLGELFCFPVVAPHAILRRDQRRDEKPLVIVPVRFAFFGPMTFHTTDAFRCMTADFPIVVAADTKGRRPPPRRSSTWTYPTPVRARNRIRQSPPIM